MAGFGDFLKSNAKFAYGGVGAPFALLDIKNIAASDNKLKALLKTAKDLVLIKVAMVGLFTAVGAAVKSLVRETGSLDEALKKLGQIQTYSRAFATFTGGLNAAKQRIVELSAVASRGPFKFEDIVAANKSLQIFTRGAYSSVEATKTIGSAAIASGNNIEDVAQAVGNFYDHLRSGAPISSATEQLRQMGIVSESTAKHLTAMADGGSDVATVFGELTAVLDASKSGTQGYREELATVTAEHAKALTELQQKFGMPFTANEITNTKNMTSALQSIGPTVGRVAGFLANLYTGFTTGFSAMVKFAAGSKVVRVALEGLTYALSALTVAAALFGVMAAGGLIKTLVSAGFGISKLLPLFEAIGISATAAATGVTILTVALRVLTVGTVVGLIATAFIGISGAIVNFVSSSHKAADAVRNQAAAHREAESAIAGHVSAISTVTERNEAMAAGIQRVIDLEKERQNLLAHGGTNTVPTTPSPGHAGPGELPTPASTPTPTPGPTAPPIDLGHPAPMPTPGFTPTPAPAATVESPEVKKKNEEIVAQKKINELIAAKSALLTPQKEALITAQFQRQAEIEESMKGPEEKEREAGAGVTAAVNVANARAALQPEIEKKKAVKEDTAELEAQQLAAGLNAPKTSAVFLETQAEQMRQAKAALEAKTPEEAKRAATLAGGVQYDPIELAKKEAEARIAAEKESRAGTFAPATREAKITGEQIGMELASHEARRAGRGQEAKTTENLLEFTKKFDELLPVLGKEGAAKTAEAETVDLIKGQVTPEVGMSAIADSLTRIGGGGGVYTPGGDATDLAKQANDLHRMAIQWLEKIYGKEGGVE